MLIDNDDNSEKRWMWEIDPFIFRFSSKLENYWVPKNGYLMSWIFRQWKEYKTSYQWVKKETKYSKTNDIKSADKNEWEVMIGHWR